MEADMKLFVAIPALLAAGCAVEDPLERAGPVPPAVAQAMEGRVAGPPLACVRQSGLRSNRVVAGAVLFEGPGGVVYVNRGLGGCQALAFGRAIRTSSPTGSLCRGDIVTAFEPVSRTEFGGCTLGEFIPYHRVD